MHEIDVGIAHHAVSDMEILALRVVDLRWLHAQLTIVGTSRPPGTPSRSSPPRSRAATIVTQRILPLRLQLRTRITDAPLGVKQRSGSRAARFDRRRV
jgi:hypothetical protein